MSIWTRRFNIDQYVKSERVAAGCLTAGCLLWLPLPIVVLVVVLFVLFGR